MKKILLVFLVFTLVLTSLLNTSFVYATGGELTISVADSNQLPVTTDTVASADTITISGTAKPYELLIISILKPDMASAQASDANVARVYYWIDDIIAGSDGRYQFSYSFSSCPTGKYRLTVVSEADNRAAAKLLTVINEAERDLTISAINSAADTDDIADIFINSDGGTNLMFDTRAFKRLSKSGSEIGLVFDKFFAESKNETVTTANLDKYKAIYEDYSALALFNQEKSVSVLNDFEHIFKLYEVSGVSKSINYVTDAKEISACLGSLCTKSYTDLNSLRKDWAAKLCVYAIKNAYYTSFEQIFGQNYSHFSGIDMQSYNQLNSKSGIATYMKNQSYTDVASFISGFNTEVARLLYIQNNPGASINPNGTMGSSGGGAGGGGGGGGADTGTTTVGGGSFNVPPQELDTAFLDIADVPWAIEGISYLQQRGIISGVSPNTFEPNRFVKREEFVKMLVLLVGGYDTESYADFSDVPSSHWSSAYIGSAVKQGLVGGIGANSFGLGRSISRQDACVIVKRAMKDLSDGDIDLEFTDSSMIADYAKDAVKFMTSLGIINGKGDGSFAPGDNMTRAQAAKILHQVSILIGG